MVVEAAGPTELAVFENAHARVRQTADFTLLGAMGSDFHDGTSRDFVWTENAELNAYYGLCLRTVRKIRHI
jgi:hypothetical protein